MRRLDVSPTKSNLLRLREGLRFAREGKDLLTQKREVLVAELLRLRDDAQKAREELDELLRRAYERFVQALLAEGAAALRRLALAIPEGPGVRLEERSVMGVTLPIVHGEERQWRPRYGLAGGSLETDRAAQLFLEVERKILEVAEIENAIYRLAAETRRTLRRERALENQFIPQYAETVKFIQDSLEERDREGFYQMKLLKGKVGR